MEERAGELTRLVAGSLDDPFRVATLPPEQHAQVAAEVDARALTGGRRVVRVRECGERLLPVLAKLRLGDADGALLVLMAGPLTGRSKLRGWAEGAGTVGAVACNADDARSRRGFVQETLSGAGLRAERDTTELLLDRLPPGRRAIAAEVEKLALLSPSGAVAWDDARALLDAGVGATVHTAIDAALAGDGPGASAAWEHAMEAGASGVGLIRILGSELNRLAAVRADADSGTPAQAALERQRIYPRDPRFRQWATAAARWAQGDVLRALSLAQEAETACKATGSDERLVVGVLLARLARGRLAGARVRRGA